MWANAQRGGRPAEHRWRPLFNATSLADARTRCPAVTLARRETHSNLEGCPKLVNRSQPLLGGSSPYYEDTWRTYCCLTSFFFRLSIRALVAKIYPNKVVRWCPDGDFWRLFASCVFSEPRAGSFRPASEIHTKATPCVEVWQTSNL